MSDQSGSPFSGLDKALLRSTQAQPPVPEAVVQSEDGKSAPVPKIAKPAKETKLVPPSGPLPAAPPTDSVEALQQSLKTIGKEIYYIRITPEEKANIEDVLHTLKRRGLRTSGNELGRIALNQLLADYEAHGEESILIRVLARMRA
jgi:hypothetical protein